jgi:hypothetical protein
MFINVLTFNQNFKNVSENGNAIIVIIIKLEKCMKITGKI